MTQNNKTLIITCALPYANSPLHLGHILEHIQADMWVRFHRLQHTKCYFICADDTHGTPIMLKAKSLNISPEEMIKQVYQDHLHDFKGFSIDFDNYYTTHSKESLSFVNDIYTKLQQNGKIYTKTINQLYDTNEQMFLPDRFVKGSCPKCRALDQYGDNCEKCGATYNSCDLINPKSILSDTTPIFKESEHYFFKLSACKEFLITWLNKDSRLNNQAKNKMNEWLADELLDWDISRDKPYFGFPIPGTVDKYFYVWLDAPVGYMSSLANYCHKHQLNFDQLWNSSTTEIHHFIGKDILYFHALFWPAVLHYAGYQTPEQIHVHGFLTVNGQKMSKSRGTFINADDYLKSGLNPEFFRYYIASKSSDKIEDFDFAIDDFTNKINSNLIGKFVNIASRSSSFLDKYFNNKLAAQINDDKLIKQISNLANTIEQLYYARDYAKVIKHITTMLDIINIYIDETKPWLMARNSEQLEQLHQVCSILINSFRIISIYLKPIIPETITKVEAYLNIPPCSWQDINKSLINHTINPYTHLLTRIEKKMTDQLINTTTNNNENIAANLAPSIEPIAPTISIEDFSKLDLRIAKIIEAKAVEGADKLIQLTLDIGEEEPRNVFAGIKKAYAAEQLVGKYTVMVANLAPRQMKFGRSDGMVLAASSAAKDSGLYILEPHNGATPGMRVK